MANDLNVYPLYIDTAGAVLPVTYIRKIIWSGAEEAGDALVISGDNGSVRVRATVSAANETVVIDFPESVGPANRLVVSTLDSGVLLVY